MVGRRRERNRKPSIDLSFAMFHLILDGSSRIISAQAVVDSADNSDEGSTPLGLVIEHIDANDHEILERGCTRPELTAELAVELQQDLLGHGNDALLVHDGFGVDHLEI